MTKKFDVVIGNPPYQEEAQGGGTRDTPIYHLFMNAAFEVSDKTVLITPARFLFNAGFTPKAWNEKMLSDRTLSVPLYVPTSGELFPGTDIKGGIAITYRDDAADGEPVGTFTRYPQLNTILHKVAESDSLSIERIVSSGRAYAYTDAMHDENPDATNQMSSDAQYRVSTNAFEQLAPIFHVQAPSDGGDYTEVLGLIKNRRSTRWIRAEYLSGPESFERYRVVLPAANGSGQLGEVLSAPAVLAPRVAVTQTFITIGAFDQEAQASACLKYIKSKFARTLLGVMKTTQHNPARTWRYVPIQDFTASSDIDWSQSIPEIDQQLYSKYGLDPGEIAFIEDNVKPMA